eukprot:Skav215532  [mRNA]  locus=scaffold4176:13843:16521:- [translate_table: standard]
MVGASSSHHAKLFGLSMLQLLLLAIAEGHSTFLLPESRVRGRAALRLAAGPALDASAVQNSVHCNIAVEWLQETKARPMALPWPCHLVF